MPTVNNKYVSDNDYLGQLRKTVSGWVGRLKLKSVPTVKPVRPDMRVRAAEPKKTNLVGAIQQHNKEIRDLTEGKY